MDRRASRAAQAWASPYAWLVCTTACTVATFGLAGPVVTLHGLSSHPQTDRGRQVRLDEALKREGDALVDLADAAMKGRALPAAFGIRWGNDFFKAQPGTFVPFTLTIDKLTRPSPGALVYVRVVARGAAPAGGRRPDVFAYETIFSVEPDSLTGEPLRLRRGFAVPPGRYSVYVALRERPADLLARGRPPGPRRSSVLIHELDVPDFWTEGLTTSTVIVADRVEQLGEPIPPGRLDEDPYVVGTTRIHPASRSDFGRGGELIVVFLVYNPSVGPDKHFDVQVDYHVYRKVRDGDPPGDRVPAQRAPARPGERYVTRTNPQRFNPPLMGTHFDPAGGQPVLAGQGILLSGFEDGEYRLGITVTDLLSGKTVARDVAFTVIGS